MAVRRPRSRNESAEGGGKARARWFSYLSTLDPRLLDISGYLNTSTVWDRHDPDPDEFDEAKAKHAKEFAEMMGFWISWHLAGGFDQLEERGWHRATIYRKIKRFREMFDEHPDEYEFDWLKVDHHKAWNADLAAMLGSEETSP